MPHESRRLRVLTWQVHGNYCYYLSQVPVDWWLVTRPGHPPGYAGRTPSFPWGDNVHEVAPEDIAQLDFDLVLYQSRVHWEEDRARWLTPRQRQQPALYLEHDPPQQHPTNTPHWAQEASLLVHVTPFNALMWDSGQVPVRVIEHTAVLPEGVRYQGTRPEGVVVVNHLKKRGRRLGADVYETLRREVPLVLVGMAAEEMPGGLGEIRNTELAAFMAQYRFFFNPIRWTSLGLAVVEAMTVGLPIVGLATTEMSTVVENGVNGWVDTDLQRLAEVMQRLIADPALARRWGEAGREKALQRFGQARFVREWLAVLEEACAHRESLRRVAS